MKQIIVLKIKYEVCEELKFYENDLFSFKKMMSDLEEELQDNFGESLLDYGVWRGDFNTYSDLLSGKTLLYTDNDSFNCYVSLEVVKSGIEEVEL